MGLAVSFNTIAEMFDNLTEKFASEARPVMMYKSNGKYTGIRYSELREQVLRCAGGFSKLGVKGGDHVAIISENRIEWVIADMALVRLGAVTVPMYPTLTTKQVAFIMNDAGVTSVIVSNKMQADKILKVRGELPALKNIVVMAAGAAEGDGITNFSDLAVTDVAQGDTGSAALPAPDDLLTIIYTSGTTGNPKGVMLTHKNMVSNMQGSAPCFPISPEDIMLSYLPFSHSFERMAGYYTGTACGATIAFAESIESVRENLLEIRPTLMTTVPRLFERLYNRIYNQLESKSPLEQKIFHWSIKTGLAYNAARRKRSVSPLLAIKHAIADRLVFQKIRERTGGRLKYFVSGGAALAQELGEFFEAIGIIIIEGYGMTEASPAIAVNRVEDYRFGTVGKPVQNLEVRIAEDGEILVRGANVMKGYWNNPGATRDAVDPEGWLHTGDIGLLDNDGYLKITDRKKDIFVNSGGKNIAPLHIESHFTQFPYIDQIVLIGDKRMFCTALIVPDFELLKDFAKKHAIAFSSNADLVKSEEVLKLYDKEIQLLQKDLANYERVRKFALLPQPFSVETGELTPTLKVKRKVIDEKYKEVIDGMYESIQSRS